MQGCHLVVTISWLLFLDPWGLGNAMHPPSPSHVARELVTQELSPQVKGAECSHHSECASDCCLMDLDRAGAFCAPKARMAMLCLFQVRLWAGTALLRRVGEVTEAHMAASAQPPPGRNLPSLELP